MSIHLLNEIKNKINGEFYVDEKTLRIYATDASSYRELPMGVAVPKDESDLLLLIQYANKYKWSLIPRAGGTSLAGQVVGNGIIVDISKYLNKIIEINETEQWVKVQPGVIRDDLNIALTPFKQMFAPQTSTSNRAMIGGMVGNNSCGANSIVYGSTREHIISVTGFLSDGTKVCFKEVDKPTFLHYCTKGEEKKSKLEYQLYHHIHSILSKHKEGILQAYPNPSIHRRNTGYAVDILLDSTPFKEGGTPFNFSKLIAGSEGTLLLITEIKLRTLTLPTVKEVIFCPHFDSISSALQATIIALSIKPAGCELIDNYVLECTKTNILQKENRKLIKGNPKAILIISFKASEKEILIEKVKKLEDILKKENLGYYYPSFFEEDIKKIWSLRKAGLGLLSTIPGDAKPVPVVEDTAVMVEQLPQYIKEFNIILKKHHLEAVHYAHAGAGELHIRPIINLKKESGKKVFRAIAKDIAHLVKKYKGSLSGEHGDGRLRGEFIPIMIGEKNYQILKNIKTTWDKNNIFNPNKIVDTPKMNTFLRYDNIRKEKFILDTYFHFPEKQNFLQSAELCNGSGDCRKSDVSNGVMCPSYRATRDEKDTTRARANILREILNHKPLEEALASKQIYEVMDLCLSCKACKSECPSNVDISKLKAEFLQHYYHYHPIPIRTLLIGNFTRINHIAQPFYKLYNFIFSTPFITTWLKKSIGFAKERSIPSLHKYTLIDIYKKKKYRQGAKKKKVLLFCDEFTNYNDVSIGLDAIELLELLGYHVIIPKHIESGRSFISKGLLKEAKFICNENIRLLKDIVSENTCLIGIEPSAILSFRDEYLDLATKNNRETAIHISKNTFLIDEFFCKEIDKGNITSLSFGKEAKKILLHGHCHQKTLSNMNYTKRMLHIPQNYDVELIPSGCCGMAGSFGYEKEHYELSKKIANATLIPYLKKNASNKVIAATGTSCRHQIKDLFGMTALHPITILRKSCKL